MSSVILTGETSGTLTLSAPLVAGSNTVTLPAATGTRRFSLSKHRNQGCYQRRSQLWNYSKG